MEYKLVAHPIGGPSVLRLADVASIPADPNNRDYAAYLTWLAAGNTPIPADPLPETEPTRAEKLVAARAAIGADPSVAKLSPTVRAAMDVIIAQLLEALR